jgi:hypothetical protein
MWSLTKITGAPGWFRRTHAGATLRQSQDWPTNHPAGTAVGGMENLASG